MANLQKEVFNRNILKAKIKKRETRYKILAPLPKKRKEKEKKNRNKRKTVKKPPPNIKPEITMLLLNTN